MRVRSRPFGLRRRLSAVVALLLCSTIATIIVTCASPARADEKITYLFPAPPILPAFGPIQIAKGKGYFSQAGLDVNYAVGRGGVDVAKEVGAGNVPLGGIVADGPIVVRQNGVPVKIVAQPPSRNTASRATTHLALRMYFMGNLWVAVNGRIS